VRVLLEEETVTLYYNQHLGMMKPLMEGWSRSEVLAKVPPRKQAKKRMKFLDKRQLFDCPNCRCIVRWDFGADVGHPDAKKYEHHGDTRQLDIPNNNAHVEWVLKIDKYLRLCCDECWAAIVNGKEPRKGWDL
jgi:hypothetical protein